MSVLLAAFSSRHLEAAIASALRQTFQDFELLVLDDSHDAEVERLMERFVDDRIRYVPSERLGVALNHSRGIALARSELVSILNHDDVWEPDLLEKLVPPLDDGDVILAFADHFVIRSDGVVDQILTAETSARWGRTTLAPGRHQPFGDIAIARQSIPIAQAAVWRRSAIHHIPRWVDDRYDFWIGARLAATGETAIYVPERLARFRLHQSNLGGDGGLRRRVAGLVFATKLATDSSLATFRRPLLGRWLAAIMSVVKWPGFVARRVVVRR